MKNWITKLTAGSLLFVVSSGVAQGKLTTPPSQQCYALNASAGQIMRKNEERFARAFRYFRSFTGTKQARATELADQIEKLTPYWFSGKAKQDNKESASILDIDGVFNQLANELQCTSFTWGVGPSPSIIIE